MSRTRPNIAFFKTQAETTKIQFYHITLSFNLLAFGATFYLTRTRLSFLENNYMPRNTKIKGQRIRRGKGNWTLKRILLQTGKRLLIL